MLAVDQGIAMVICEALEWITCESRPSDYVSVLGLITLFCMLISYEWNFLRYHFGRKKKQEKEPGLRPEREFLGRKRIHFFILSPKLFLSTILVVFLDKIHGLLYQYYKIILLPFGFPIIRPPTLSKFQKHPPHLQKVTPSPPKLSSEMIVKYFCLY